MKIECKYKNIQIWVKVFEFSNDYVYKKVWKVFVLALKIMENEKYKIWFMKKLKPIMELALFFTWL